MTILRCNCFAQTIKITEIGNIAQYFGGFAATDLSNRRIQRVSYGVWQPECFSQIVMQKLSRPSVVRDLANLVLLLMLARTVSAQTNDPAAADPLLSSIHSQTRQFLFGDWGGKRSALAEKGITFDFFYISDLLANPSGGVQQTQGGGSESVERSTLISTVAVRR